jgi:hypothetical protein
LWLRQSLEAAFFTMSSFKLEMRERQPCPGFQLDNEEPRYNALKRAHEGGSQDDYNAAKRDFFHDNFRL